MRESSIAPCVINFDFRYR